jgi:hypothetical protein
MRTRPLQIVLLLLLLGSALGACTTQSPPTSPAPQEVVQVVTPETGQAQDDVVIPVASLPPPLIVTIPADRLDITIDTSAAAEGAITTQGGVNAGLIQFEDGLPAEVADLLDRIYSGEYPIDTTGQAPGSLPATYTYSDMDGDGFDDLVIILVVDTGEFADITAGASYGNPVIQIIPRPEPGTVVEGLSIPVDDLLAMGDILAGERGDGGTYLITLGPEDLSRWSQPFLPE